MRTMIIHLAKGISILFYWAVVALFVWLFYDEYLIEGSWLSICLCIAFFSIGCTIKPFFISWIYKNELQNFQQKHTQFYEKLEKIIWVIVCIFGVIAIVFFLTGIGLIPMGISILYGLVKIIIYAWECWLGLLISFVACFVLKALKSPVIRIARKLIYRLSLLLTVGLIAYIEVCYVWHSFAEENFVTTSIAAGGIVLLVLGGVSLYLFYKSVQKGILTFAVNKYVLYLRAFKSDDDILYNKVAESIDKMPLMRIGNPNKEESEDTNEHWLPMSNWKFFLKFYIARAKAIVIAISLTEGVIWEVVQNMKHLNKCIIYFSSHNELVEFKEKLILINNGNLDLIIHAIEKVTKIENHENSFVINNNTILLGDVCGLTNAVLKNDFRDIKQINITKILNAQNNSKHINSLGSIKEFIFRKFHILNFVNSLENIHNSTLRGLLKGVGIILAVMFFVAYFLVALLTTFCPLVAWFDQEFKDMPIIIKVLLSYFFFGLGLRMLRDIFNTFKKK